VVEKILVIIPTYNEKENIRELMIKLLQVVPDLEILVIDDNSPDGTGGLVSDFQKSEKRVYLLQRPQKLGLGSAYLAGFKWALERDYQLIFEMDADFSHDPAYIGEFIEAAKTSDLVIGSRYLHGEVRVVNWPLSRLFISQTANWYVRLITGLPIYDCTSGFKCFRREVLEKINLNKIHSEGYSFQVEINFLAHQKGFRIKEIPIIFNDRICGRSKLDRKSVWEMLWLVWLLRLRKIWP
jgi:dolichol-phosphate mannosyltransferase